jgi:endo-alpha-1,4-polygalactosaminidase (GH114 family)
MIAWVREVSAVAKGGERPLFVIAQNAAPLLQDSSYVDAIDGVSHEDIWFTGADGLAEGDCPVPRTAAEVGSAAYLARLNKACRRSHDKDPASAMRFVGEDVIVPLLKFAQNQGKAVFTVDYALKAENISTARAASLSFGFIPFVGARNLNIIVSPPGADDVGK